MIIDKLSRHARQFFFKAHESTNHWYEEPTKYTTGKLYSHHLELTADVVRKMIKHTDLDEQEQELAIAAAYGHDAVSDARLTYNDIKKELKSDRLAKICCNLCEDVWGKNRDERNSDAYYERLVSDRISTFVKICDRIANVEYGLYEGNSKSVLMYYAEQRKFYDKLKVHSGFEEVWNYLIKLFICNAESTIDCEAFMEKQSRKLYDDPEAYKLELIQTDEQIDSSDSGCVFYEYQGGNFWQIVTSVSKVQFHYAMHIDSDDALEDIDTEKIAIGQIAAINPENY